MSQETPSLVLIAANDQAVRDALQFALRLEGFGVRTHSTDADLLADPRLGEADCIVLDDQRPHLDGMEVLRRIKALEVKASVILLTNYATNRLRSRAAKAGVSAVLEKPLLNNALLDSLRNLLAAPPPG